MNEAFVERVLTLVETIPRGKVVAYGDVAAILGQGGPRQVAQVMARYGDTVPWWRVLRADGTCAPEVSARQLVLLRREKVPMQAERVAMASARWRPPLDR